jgi:hypothetical protein
VTIAFSPKRKRVSHPLLANCEIRAISGGRPAFV